MNLPQFVKQQISSALPNSSSVNLILGSDSLSLPTLLDELDRNKRKHLTIPSEIISKSQPHDVWLTANRIRRSGKDVVLVFSHLDQLEQHESAIHQCQLASKNDTHESARPGTIFLLLTNTNQHDLTPAVQRCVDSMFIDS